MIFPLRIKYFHETNQPNYASTLHKGFSDLNYYTAVKKRKIKVIQF